MNRLECLIQAVKALNLEYELLPYDSGLTVTHEGEIYLFYLWHLPFNRIDHMRVCKSKFLTMTLLNKYVKFPRWNLYFGLTQSNHYRKFTDSTTVEEISEKILADYPNYPFILKPNDGSQGKGVAKISSKEELVDALTQLGDPSNESYDPLIIAQEYIDIEAEYRVIFHRGDVALAYEKSTKGAVFNGNLSPLHWEGANAIHVTDSGLLEKFNQFMAGIWPHYNINYCGADIAIDKNGVMWLIELNSSPMVSLFLKQNDPELLVGMYKSIIGKEFNISI